MKQTKDELISALAVSQEKTKRLSDADEYRRKEIARAFGWLKKKGQYDYSDSQDPIVPTWEQIFVELGKLLRDKNYNMLSSRVDLIHREVEEMKTSIVPPLNTL